MDQLSQLKKITKVVADSGDVGSIEAFKPQDATTNPSLILKASEDPRYQHHLQEAIDFAKTRSNNREEQLKWALRKLSVNFGVSILKYIPGRVSTEVDAHLSFDQNATIAEAEALMDLYAQAGVDPNRVLIKIAATWEGIQAAAQLERKGIRCNLTLIFHFAQALLCAVYGITLVSPFVGRIYDWYKKNHKQEFTGLEDPGVQSVRQIYNYYKKFKYATIVMGASFRNIGQVQALAGCDYLTISPALLQELQDQQGELKRVLSPELAEQDNISKVQYDEASFRFALNDSPMATEKLAEGIRLFAMDAKTLEQKIKALL